AYQGWRVWPNIPLRRPGCGGVRWRRGTRGRAREGPSRWPRGAAPASSRSPGARGTRPPTSVPEVPVPREDHRQAELVGGGEDLRVPDRAARLHDGGHPRRRRGVEAVAEREERVGGAGTEIGRASCRERGWTAGGRGAC